MHHLHFGLFFIRRRRKDLYPIDDQFLLEGNAHNLVLLAAMTKSADQAGVYVLP